MSEENGGFVGGEDAFSLTHLAKYSNNFFSMEMQSSPYPQNDDVDASYALEMELQMHHLQIGQCFDGRHHLPAPDDFNQFYAADLLNVFDFLPQPSNGTAVDDRERNVGAVFEFTAQNRNGGGIKQYSPTEKMRRRRCNEKYDALKSLLPTPTKKDRASILGDAISYIDELKRTVSELKVLVEKKRYAIEKRKRSKQEHNATVEMDPYNASMSLRSSWLHRKSKNIEVDVRIIDDEVTVKLVQQKRVNCLLFVSRVLDELQLDLHHVAGGVIGDYYSYLFNSKICEGSIVYASAVANKVIEVVDKQYAAFLPTTTY